MEVLDEAGKPGNFGWARSPLFNYDPSKIRSSRRFVSESDRYILISPSHLIIMEIMDHGYLGYAGISVVSLKDKKRSTQYYRVPLSMGSLGLSPQAETGSARFRQKKSMLDFAAMESGARIIRADIPKFGHHRVLRGEIVLTPAPGAESIVTNMPWRREKNAFRFSRRSPWYTAEGVIQFGAAELFFTQGRGWGIFDWSREIRPGQDLRYWAAAAGVSKGQSVGFSVGYGTADSSEGTENAFFLNGKLHKLDQVSFHISPADWLEPWRFTSNDNRLEMAFRPHQERFENHGFFFHSLKRRQVCGSFTGQVILDDGSTFDFQNITGLAERRSSRF